MLLSGINNIETYSKWFCATELYAIKRNMLITGMRLSGVDCIGSLNLKFGPNMGLNVPYYFFVAITLKFQKLFHIHHIKLQGHLKKLNHWGAY